MPNISVQLRRGTDTEHSSFTGAVGEVTVDTTNNTLRVHDNSTAGGIRLAKLSEVSGGTGTVTSVGSGTGLTGGPITTSGTLSIANGGVDTTQLADDAVTADKLADTTVTAGAYTNADITVDAQGRITAAANGSSAVSKWDSGWVSQDDQGTPISVGSGATMILDHDLGSAALGSVFSVYAAEDASGTNMEAQSFEFDQLSNGTNQPRGIQIQSITSTQVTAQLSGTGYTVTSAGNYGSKAWGTSASQFSHIRVVLVG